MKKHLASTSICWRRWKLISSCLRSGEKWRFFRHFISSATGASAVYPPKGRYRGCRGMVGIHPQLVRCIHFKFRNLICLYPTPHRPSFFLFLSVVILLFWPQHDPSVLVFSFGAFFFSPLFSVFCTRLSIKERSPSGLWRR